MAPLLPVVLGVVTGVAYFALAERHVGRANCSWSDPLGTDLASIGIGGYLAWRGSALREPLVAAAGGAMCAVHVAQLAYQNSEALQP